MKRVMDGFYQGFCLFPRALSSEEEMERLRGLLSDYNSILAGVRQRREVLPRLLLLSHGPKSLPIRSCD